MGYLRLCLCRWLFQNVSYSCLPAEIPDYDLRVSYITDLVRALPLPNHNTMELLFKHLRR